MSAEPGKKSPSKPANKKPKTKEEKAKAKKQEKSKKFLAAKAIAKAKEKIAKLKEKAEKEKQKAEKKSQKAIAEIEKELKKYNDIVVAEMQKMFGDGEGTKKEKKAISDEAAAAAFGKVFSEKQLDEKAAFVKNFGKPVLPENVFDDFFEASGAVKEALFKLIEEDPTYIQLIKSTPGIGKTEAALFLLIYYSNNGVMPFFAAPTKSQVWQVFDRFKSIAEAMGKKVIFAQGRHGGYIRDLYLNDGTNGQMKVTPNCYNIDKVEKARARGYNPQSAVCTHCPSCPYFINSAGDKTGVSNACQYFKDYYAVSQVNKKENAGKKDQPIALMTHAMAACIVTDSEIVKPEVLVFDENFMPAMRERIEWNEDELQRVIDVPQLVQLRRLMRQSIRVAKRFKALSELPKDHEEVKALSEIEQVLRSVLKDVTLNKRSITLSNIDLYLVMRQAAYEMSCELRPLLEAASTCETGIERGAFMHMKDDRYERLPHAKEPDLALDMLSLIDDAKQGKKVAYRISLRKKTKEEPWAFFRDSFRTVNYGERLLILDAYGNEKLYKAVCGREVKTTEVKCKMRSNVTLYHYDEKTSRKFMDDVERRLKLYYRYVLPVLEKSKNLKVLIYTQKRYVEWLKGIISRSKFGTKEISYKWFWMDHGDDNYGDYDKLIVFGSAYTNVDEMIHTANAINYGKEPIDTTKLANGDYKDELLMEVKKSLEIDEMMQIIFRLRPSKPRLAPQQIHIISAMKLPLDYEMPGAVKRMNYKPDYNKESFLGSMWRLYNELGFYVNSLAPFIYEKELVIDWYKNGGAASGQEPLLPFDEFKMRYNLFNDYHYFKRSRDALAMFTGEKPTRIDYHGTCIPVWGDKKKAVAFLDELRKEFYEPGCYDDDPFAQTPENAGVEDQQPLDDEQLSKEAKKKNGKKTNGKGFDILGFMNEAGFYTGQTGSCFHGKHDKKGAAAGADTS